MTANRYLCLFCVLFGLCSAPVPGEQPPAAAFASLPAISHVDISPNGQYLAWADRAGAREIAVIYELATQKSVQQVDFDAATKLRGLRWADDEALLVDYSSTVKDAPGAARFEFYRTLAVDVKAGSRRMLLMNGGQRQGVTNAVLVALHTSQPHTVIMWSRDFSAVEKRRQMETLIPNQRGDTGWVSVLFAVDTASGRGTPIDKGDSFTGEWLVDRDGSSVARSDWKPKGNKYTILAKRSYGGWREVYRRTDGAQPKLAGLTADEQSILAIGPNRAGRQVVWAIPRNGASTKVFLEDHELDVESLLLDRYTNAPIGARLGGIDQPLQWIDPDAEARYQSVATAFPAKRVEIVGMSEDHRRAIARVDGASDPAIYYYVDFTTNKADVAGEEYPQLGHLPLGIVRTLHYRARDGATIPAYLTLPPGENPQNLPMVVLPHGGPEARDNAGFDWWSQFLATRGYAVLRPQFRGSTGFGDAFRRAGYRQWGGRMQDDVTDGVKAMIADGVADPRRICIVGGSYGGYAALAGAAFTPDLYKCAVSVNGVADLPAMIGNVKAQNGAESDSVAYWQDNIGSPYDRKVGARSPVNAAGQVRIPILLMHGVDDTVVPIAQSEAMARALSALGKPVQFVRLPGEDHWLSRSETRLRVLTEIEAFMREHL